jgi:SAM-dependent methyltransferase
MHRADPLAALEADLETTLLVDRRKRHLAEAAQAAGLVVAEVWELASKVDRVPIYAALLGPPERNKDPAVGYPFPKRIDTADVTYLRFVDRFYIPAARDPTISAALFDLIASVYDRITSPDVNIETARMLLNAVLRDCGLAAPRILDFGCGTGLALKAAYRLEVPLAGLELVGTDISVGMLELAASRGERVMQLDEWRALPNHSFDGAISAFVFHFGVPREDLLRIALQLRPGARFAANYFKANSQAVEILVSDLAECGLVLQRTERLITTPHSENPMLIFAKGACEC